MIMVAERRNSLSPVLAAASERARLRSASSGRSLEANSRSTGGRPRPRARWQRPPKSATAWRRLPCDAFLARAAESARALGRLA